MHLQRFGGIASGFLRSCGVPKIGARFGVPTRRSAVFGDIEGGPQVLEAPIPNPCPLNPKTPKPLYSPHSTLEDTSEPPS